MKINSGTINMNAASIQKNTTSLSGKGQLSPQFSLPNSDSKMQGYNAPSNEQTKSLGKTDSFEFSSTQTFSYTYSSLYTTGNANSLSNNAPRSISDINSVLSDMHTEFIKRLEELMERIRMQLLGYKPANDSIIDLNHTNTPGSLWTRTVSTVTEEEYMTFETKGQVVTEDGRSIDFNMSLSMSRQFTQTVESMSSMPAYMLTDPLVVKLSNIPDSINSVADEKWMFDIDGDGKCENISRLTQGNAFLALDKDGNGKIDDGNELFGAKTGNGFAELAAYDEDGNGFIDENDSIFDKLKVWTGAGSDNEKLSSLKDADIGAIFLGSVGTGFSLKDMSNNTNAVIRQSGFFLHESTGQTGLIQQIDFAS